MKKLSLLFFAIAFSLSALLMACGNTEDSKPESTAAPAASDAPAPVDDENNAQADKNVQADKSAEKEAKEANCEKCKKGDKTHKHSDKG